MFNLRNEDINGSKANTTGNQIIKKKERKEWRPINQTDDIPGAQSNTLKKGIITKRCLDPLTPAYKVPGHFQDLEYDFTGELKIENEERRKIEKNVKKKLKFTGKPKIHKLEEKVLPKPRNIINGEEIVAHKFERKKISSQPRNIINGQEIAKVSTLEESVVLDSFDNRASSHQKLNSQQKLSEDKVKGPAFVKDTKSQIPINSLGREIQINEKMMQENQFNDKKVKGAALVKESKDFANPDGYYFPENSNVKKDLNPPNEEKIQGPAFVKETKNVISEHGYDKSDFMNNNTNIVDEHQLAEEKVKGPAFVKETVGIMDHDELASTHNANFDSLIPDIMDEVNAATQNSNLQKEPIKNNPIIDQSPKKQKNEILDYADTIKASSKYKAPRKKSSNSNFILRHKRVPLYK